MMATCTCTHLYGGGGERGCMKQGELDIDAQDVSVQLRTTGVLAVKMLRLWPEPKPWEHLRQEVVKRLASGQPNPVI